METSAKNSQSSGPPSTRSGGAVWLRVLLLTSPISGGLIVALVLDWTGAVAIDRRLDFHGELIANVLLYWLVLVSVIAALVCWRGFGAWLRVRRAPLMAMGVSLALSFGAVEIALRMLRVPQAMPEFRWVKSRALHHANPANADAYYLDVRYRTNEDGLRTRHSRESFGQHDVRIVAMGDSFAFGLGVAQPKVVSTVLEKELRTRTGRDDLAVVNAGVVSYAPFLQRAQFREVVRDYRPTLTLLFLDANDIGDDYKYADMNVSTDPDRVEFDVEESGPGLYSAALTFVYRFGFFFRAPILVLQRFFPELRSQDDYYDLELNIGGVIERDHWFILRHPLELTRPYFEASMSYIADIAAEAEAVGSEFVLVVSPRSFQWSDRECPANWEGGRYALDEPHEYAMFEFFESMRGEVDFRILSLLSAFQQTDEFPLVFNHDPHWNAKGHGFVARQLADYLLAEELIPSN